MKTLNMFVGPSHEQWSPKSIKDGIGGSEEMFINMAFELSKTYKVTVWNRCLDDEGVYDGVEYKNYDDFDVKETDYLIICRSPQMLLKYKLNKVKGKKYLWLHDTINPLEVICYLMGFDGIFTASEWHHNYYEQCCAPEFRKEIIQTRNAVDYSLFNQKVERDPYTMVYGSLYNRGLVQLLTLWPKIKLAVPQAKLRIFYGWQTIEKLMPLKDFQIYKKQVEDLMDQEGITHLGRISHKEVAKEMLGAGVWAYPCIEFNEISCITAMKAQIGGAIPVVIPKAALNETVKYGVKVSHGKNSEDILNNWADELIKILNDPKGQEQFRKVMMNLSKDVWNYETLAKSWIKIFGGKDDND
jgi:glycosyltransferase involved in cell wall biosynthesis